MDSKDILKIFDKKIETWKFILKDMRRPELHKYNCVKKRFTHEDKTGLVLAVLQELRKEFA